MIEEKNRLDSLCALTVKEEKTEHVYLSTQGQLAIKSWFKVSKYTKVFAWGYVVMTAAMIVFAIASKGVEERLVLAKNLLLNHNKCDIRVYINNTSDDDLFWKSYTNIKRRSS